MNDDCNVKQPKEWVTRVKATYLAGCVALAVPVMSAAQIQTPTTPGVDGSDPVASGKAVGKGILELFIYFLFIVAFIAAAWAAIDGLFRGIRKGEWGQFAMGLGAALIMLIFVGWVLSQGETALTNLG